MKFQKIDFYIYGIRFFVFILNFPLISSAVYFLAGIFDGFETHMKRVRGKVLFDNDNI